MPTIFLFLISDSVAARDEMWLLCIAHQLDTRMRTIIKDFWASGESDDLFVPPYAVIEIFDDGQYISKSTTKDWLYIKEIIGQVKRSHKNNKLSVCFFLSRGKLALVQFLTYAKTYFSERTS